MNIMYTAYSLADKKSIFHFFKGKFILASGAQLLDGSFPTHRGCIPGTELQELGELYKVANRGSSAELYLWPLW